MKITVTQMTYSTSVWLLTYYTNIIIRSFFGQRTMAEWRLVSEKFSRKIVEKAKAIPRECLRKGTGQLMTYDVNVTRKRLSVGNNINIIYSCLYRLSVYQYWPTQHRGKKGLRTCESSDFLLYSTIASLSDNTFLYNILQSLIRLGSVDGICIVVFLKAVAIRGQNIKTFTCCSQTGR